MLTGKNTASEAQVGQQSSKSRHLPQLGATYCVNSSVRGMPQHRSSLSTSSFRYPESMIPSRNQPTNLLVDTLAQHGHAVPFAGCLQLNWSAGPEYPCHAPTPINEKNGIPFWKVFKVNQKEHHLFRGMPRKKTTRIPVKAGDALFCFGQVSCQYPCREEVKNPLQLTNHRH